MMRSVLLRSLEGLVQLPTERQRPREWLARDKQQPGARRQGRALEVTIAGDRGRPRSAGRQQEDVRPAIKSTAPMVDTAQARGPRGRPSYGIVNSVTPDDTPSRIRDLTISRCERFALRP